MRVFLAHLEQAHSKKLFGERNQKAMMKAQCSIIPPHGPKNQFTNKIRPLEHENIVLQFFNCSKEDQKNI